MNQSKKYGGEDFGKTLEQLKRIAPLAETINGVSFEGNAAKVGAILELAGVSGELISDIEVLTAQRDTLMTALQAMIDKATKQNWNDAYPAVLEQAYEAMAVAVAP